jgi:phosphopantothenoylcysteine synthetase/decarboxylase
MSVMEGLLFLVSGSIAAAGVPLIVQLLLERRVAKAIHIVLSERARVFVSETTLATLTGRPCVVDLFEEAKNGRAIHVDLAAQCQLAVVAPASADIISKLAVGICDDSVSIALSVFTNPVLIFPAIHPVTFRKSSIQRNLNQLSKDGYVIIGPVDGYSISEHRRLGQPGAMPGPEDVAAIIERIAKLNATNTEKQANRLDLE